MKTLFRTIVCSFVFFCIITSSIPIAAQWIENGAPVSTAAIHQDSQQLVRTESGMVVIVWEDSRDGYTDIYAQCIDPYGYMLWTPDGVSVCTATDAQIDPVIVTDGAGGVIIGWPDNRTGDMDIYAQRLDPDGNALWPAGGVLVCTAPFDQNKLNAIPDGSGGVIFTWQDERYGIADIDIFAEKIDASGSGQWYLNGLLICGVSGNQTVPEIVTDGDGGAVIAWNHATVDIYAMRVRNDGVLMWTVGGEAVSTATGPQYGVTGMSYGDGGAIFGWQDHRGSDYDVYIQHMDPTGSPVWTGGGIPVCTATNNQYIDGIVTDGNGGAIITWDDFRTSNGDIYAQRVNRNGLTQWTVGVNTLDGEQSIYGTISDGVGGAILTYSDDRNGDWDIYAQRIHYDYGGPLWGSGGVLLCDCTGVQNWPLLVSDGAGGTIVAWYDEGRSLDSARDLYAQRIGIDGQWGYPCPWIFETTDVPNDQGGRVMLTWAASRLDHFAEIGIDHYSVWRLLGGLEMQALMDAGIEETDPEMICAEFEGEAYRFISLEGAMYGFEWLANLDSHQMEIYSYAAATLYDSTAADPGQHTFMVSAHIGWAFWDSPPVLAYSVDNLAPCMPLALAGEQSFAPNGMDLSWTPNTEPDLGGYKIYRDIGISFEPGTGNLIATTCDNHLFDGDWGWDVGFCYKVSAVDVNGNESDFAILCGEQVTGDDPMPVPDKTFLSQNFPNPFNPNTTIAFGLKEQGHVSLMIYDAAGRLVANLVDESKPAGSYSANWNGTGSDSRFVSSGVYFYRLITKEFEETKKMILLR